jgi:hypothetical protein
MLAAVLLPAFLLGTLPHTVCLCSDGQREEFCPTATCRFSGRAPVAKPHLECCCQQEPGQSRRSCCVSSEHRGAGNPSNSCAAALQSGARCCQRIVEAPAPANPLKQREDVSQVGLALAADVAPPMTLALHPHSGLACAAAADPPIDLVIVLRRLII